MQKGVRGALLHIEKTPASQPAYRRNDLFSLPENQIAKDNPLNIVDIDCAAPAAPLIYGAVFIRGGQGSAGRKLRAIGENDLRLDTDLILKNAPGPVGCLVRARLVEVFCSLVAHFPDGTEGRQFQSDDLDISIMVYSPLPR